MGLLGFLRGEEPGPLKKRVVQWREGTGGLGEYLTEYALEHGNLPGRSDVFRNVLVPRISGPTDTSEIDVLLLHSTGVYVMESKNYGGWIFGSADQQQWTQTFETGLKERFYNPILQNRSHVKALAAHLGLAEDAFRSYIVFSERCELKKVPESTVDYLICKRNRMLKELRRDIAARETVFDEKRFEELQVALSKLRDASTPEAKAEHVEQTGRVQAGEVCPHCGGELVMRQGRYGEFLGCENYPRCRFTRDVR